MRAFNKIIASILVITFGLSSVAFGMEPNSFKLSPPSSFSNMKGPEFKEAAQIRLGILEALKNVRTFDADTLRSLGNINFAEKTVFTQNKIMGTIVFNDLEECAVSANGISIEYGHYLVKAIIMDKTYYCLISLKDSASGYEVSVVSERVVNEALEKGVVRFTHVSVNAEDKTVLDKYTGHEISDEGDAAIDEWIRSRMERGQYVVRAASKTMHMLYRNAERYIPPALYDYVNMLTRISGLLKNIGVMPDNNDLILKTLKGRSLVLIPYEDEKELPSINIGGQAVRVKAHASLNAIYIFMPRDLYSQTNINHAWSDAAADYIESKLIHEIGALCGLDVDVQNGEAVNILDAAVSDLRSGRPWILPENSVFKDLHPVDLCDLSLRRDYAAGNIETAKSYFMRAMSLLLAGVMGALPACSKPAVKAPEQKTITTKKDQNPREEFLRKMKQGAGNLEGSVKVLQNVNKTTDALDKTLQENAELARKIAEQAERFGKIKNQGTTDRDKEANTSVGSISDLNRAIELDPKSALAYFNRAVAYGELKQYDKAIADYTKAIELDPEYANIYSNRGEMYRRLNQYDKALADHNKAVELDQASAPVYNNRGAAYAELKQYDKAIADYTKTIELDPEYAPAYSNRGAAYAELDQYGKAIADYTKALELDPKFDSACRNRGAAYIVLKQYDKAIADYTKAIELDPEYAPAYGNRGLAYGELNQYDKAIADLDKALALDPSLKGKNDALKKEMQQRKATPVDSSYKLLLISGRESKLAADQTDAEIADYNKAIKLNPKDPNAYSNRGSRYGALGQYDKAIEDFTKAIELNPKDALSYFLRAVDYAELKKYDKAIEDYTKTLELNPENNVAYYGRGDIYMKLKQYDNAIADFTNAIKFDREYVIAYTDRGLAYFLSNRHDEAGADLDKALALNPSDAGSKKHIDTLQKLMPQRKPSPANTAAAPVDPFLMRDISSLSYSIERDPEAGYLYLKRGDLYVDARQYDKAMDDYNKAMELNPKDSRPFVKRGEAYVELNQLNKAMEDYKKAIELDPEDVIAYCSRAKAYGKARQYDKAMADLDKALALAPDLKEFIDLIREEIQQQKPSGSSEAEGEAAAVEKVSAKAQDTEKQVSEVLWMAGNGFMTKAEAKLALAKTFADNGMAPKERSATIDVLLAQAGLMFAGIGAISPAKFPQPARADIEQIAAKIKELDIEVYIPSTHLINNSTGQFRRTMEATFGDRLVPYQNVGSLPALIKNPSKAIVMTVDLKGADVASLEEAKASLAGARFMNFANRDDLQNMASAGGDMYENYIAEILSILLSARVVTPEEADQKSGLSYGMLAHLLEDYLPDGVTADAYINEVVNDKADLMARLGYITKTVLRALPINIYNKMRGAVETLWSV